MCQCLDRRLKFRPHSNPNQPITRAKTVPKQTPFDHSKPHNFRSLSLSLYKPPNPTNRPPNPPMSVVRLRPVLLHFPHDRDRRFSPPRWGVFRRRTVLGGFRTGVRWREGDRRWNGVVRAKSVDSVVEKKDDGVDVVFEETLRLDRNETVEGKVSVRLDWGKEGGPKGNVVIGCDMEGKWMLHWGVTYCDDFGSEWDQPPVEMRPPGSVPVKDYAIETPLTKSSSASQGQILHEVKIDFDCSISVAAIHFVLKDEETGSWFQRRGRDFRIPLLCSAEEDNVTGSGQKTFNIWPGAFSQISSLLLKSEESQENENTKEDALEFKEIKQNTRPVEGYSKEYPILKEKPVENSLTVAVKKDGGTNKNYLHLETDLPGKVVVHWGVSRDGSGTWQLPAAPHPPQSRLFRNKAVQTLLQQKVDGEGNWGSFPLDGGISGVYFVLKLNEYTWIRNMGGDFYIPLKSETSEAHKDQIGVLQVGLETAQPTEATEKSMLDASTSDSQEGADEIITDIRNLVTDISSEKSKSTKSKEAQENILQEIEKLAAEAYSIFRSTVPVFIEKAEPEETTTPPLTITSGTGTGYEILCQGFNWESHKSGKWYIEISEKATELAKIGFTTIWLPPPTESVSPEGYMPKDLYNLNSRYGTVEELKEVVKKLHEVNIKVLGDVVLNHRCAHFQNRNGVWNVFGGRLNWDDRAIVADDPHFQGKGNKSSGDNFHAAPNIDHSQEFVRNDIKEWLCWLRKEIGYDGWRMDFVRGFWGGYVKDYLEASGPYFVVGEYWDSLSYTYGQMDHNQDAHRQRIIDWINATNGTAGAFDVTTKGILHTALEKCEYWRLSDEKGKPPGVVGWWPSRAVTFIENHDTGSTQGHWRFPQGKEMQGYAYILTHPGTPAVFYDHLYSHYQGEVCNLISLRNRMKLNCRSTVKIVKAKRDVYAALIDDKVAMKIGPGHYEPPNDLGNWSVGAEGRDYKVWELSR